MDRRTVTNAQKRLLELLKRSRPTTASAIADAMGMTDVAARQHLTALEHAGRVRQDPQPPDGRGRPSMLWSIADPTDPLFPDRHADLTLNLIEAIRGTFGESGLNEVINARADQQVGQYKTALPPVSASLKSRVHALADRRCEEGYMADVVQEKPGCYLLIEHHCPICAAARVCTGLCAAEMEVFRIVLGSGVQIERIAHLLTGADRCIYRIRRTPKSA